MQIICFEMIWIIIWKSNVMLSKSTCLNNEAIFLWQLKTWDNIFGMLAIALFSKKRQERYTFLSDGSYICLWKEFWFFIQKELFIHRKSFCVSRQTKLNEIPIYLFCKINMINCNGDFPIRAWYRKAFLFSILFPLQTPLQS